eukprot:Colp12_sorted_trinity150504_noHs@26724
MASKPITISVFQGPSYGLDIAHNLERMKSAVKSASRKADLILFPELFLSGYDIGTAETHARAMDLNQDATIQQIKQLAKQWDISISVGYPEKSECGKIYNSCALFGRDGSLLLNYRKTHLWSDYEKEIFSAGDVDQLRVVQLPGTDYKVGLLICYDLEFPEVSRILTLQGADILLVPTALQADVTEAVIPSVVLNCRAHENQVVIAYSNFIGQGATVLQEPFTFCGRSAIVGPHGLDLARSTAVVAEPKDELLFATVDRQSFSAYRARNPYMTDRRPGLYHKIVEQPST